MKMGWVWGAVVAAALGLTACGSDDDDNGGAPAPAPTACTPPATATKTFSAAVHPILTAKCGTCHGTTWGSATRATAYAAAKERVNVTTPASSVLLQKGDAQVTHAGGDQLDPDQVATITTWIRECAQDN